MFTDTNIEIITERRKYLETVVGSDTYRVQCVEDLVNNWNMQLKLLSIIAESQTYAAYLAFVNGITKLNYFMRTNPEISHHLVLTSK